MTKISYIKYMEVLLDEQTTEEKIMEYSIIEKGVSAFDFRIVPDPDKVDIPEHLQGVESLMGLGNSLSRSLRHNRFMRLYKKRRKRKPIIVSEGDSWTQFPFIIEDIVDHLGKDYLIYSVGAAGDTADNMIYGKDRRGGQEYLKTLLKFKDEVRAFIFSAAGNDIIGEDSKTGKSALHDILKPFNGNPNDALGHVNFSVLNERLDFLRTGYQTVFDTIRSQPEFSTLPILIHGYDYVFPYPWDTSTSQDSRNPKYAAKNEWLGEPLDARHILDQQLRRNILILLIDQLYAMFGDLASQPQNAHIHIVDCRGAMPDVSMWADEIHGTSKGFKKIANRFKDTLSYVVP